MGLVCTDPPEDEPLDLEEAKLHLRLVESFTADDDLVTSLIVAARQYVEEYTHRALVVQSWEYTIDRFPCDDRILLPRPNLLSVDSVTYIDPAGAVQTLDAANYTVSTSGLPGFLARLYGTFWPSTRCQREAVTIAFTAGFGEDGDPDEVPDAIKAAMKLYIGHLYENREAVLVGSGATVVPMGVEALLGPYRVLEMA